MSSDDCRTLLAGPVQGGGASRKGTRAKRGAPEDGEANVCSSAHALLGQRLGSNSDIALATWFIMWWFASRLAHDVNVTALARRAPDGSVTNGRVLGSGGNSGGHCLGRR
jgi:hypothetical protein